MLDVFLDNIGLPAVLDGTHKFVYGKVPVYFYNNSFNNEVVEAFAKSLLDMGLSDDAISTLELLDSLVDVEEYLGFDPYIDMIDGG